jgi:hypothetical protein
MRRTALAFAFTATILSSPVVAQTPNMVESYVLLHQELMAVYNLQVRARALAVEWKAKLEAGTPAPTVVRDEIIAARVMLMRQRAEILKSINDPVRAAKLRYGFINIFTNISPQDVLTTIQTLTDAINDFNNAGLNSVAAGIAACDQLISRLRRFQLLGE